MSTAATFVRTWPALASLGAGLVHVAIAAGSGWIVGGALVVLAAAELAWAALSLIRGRVVAPRLTLGISLAAAVASVSLVFLGRDLDLAAFPLLAAAVFDTVVAASAAVVVRRGAGKAGPDALGGWRAVVGIAVGAMLVSALATPALAGTDAGAFAVPHGTHSGH